MQMKKELNIGQTGIEMRMKKKQMWTEMQMKKGPKNELKCGRRKDQIWAEMQVNKIVDEAGKAAGCPSQSWEMKI